MFAATTRTTQAASRVVARRMSTAPKLHKAKDNWSSYVNSRPPLDVSYNMMPLLFFRSPLSSVILSCRVLIFPRDFLMSIISC